MQTIRVSDNLVVEIQPGGDPNSQRTIKITNTIQQASNPNTGTTIVFDSEIMALVATLTEVTSAALHKNTPGLQAYIHTLRQDWLENRPLVKVLRAAIFGAIGVLIGHVVVTPFFRVGYLLPPWITIEAFTRAIIFTFAGAVTVSVGTTIDGAKLGVATGAIIGAMAGAIGGAFGGIVCIALIWATDKTAVDTAVALATVPIIVWVLLGAGIGALSGLRTWQKQG